MSDKTYQVLRGTVNLGERYESVFVAKVALKLALDDNIKEFFISSNNQDFHPFDDVVIETETVDGNRQLLAVQLKHGEDELTVQSLTPKNGAFSIRKYVEGTKKFEKTSRAKELSNVEWILYTPRKFRHQSRFKLENENFNIKMSPCQPETILYECFESKGLSYKFEAEETASTHYREFFKKFSLYVNQPDVYQMEKELSALFQKEFGCSESIVITYLNFINDWNNKKDTRRMLNKQWIKQLVAIQLLSSSIRALSENYIGDAKSRLFRQCIDKFDITIFDKENCGKISQLWDIRKKLEKVDMEKVNEMKDKFEVFSENIENVGDLRELESTKILWLLDKCPLIIEYNDTVITAIRLCENKKFIILHNDSLFENVRNSLENVSIFENLSDLKKHTSCYNQLIQTFSCSLQGKKQITLESLINESKNLRTQITPNDLVLFLNDNLIIGEEENNVNVYVTRSFSKHVIKEKFLENSNQNTIMIIDCLKETSRYNNRFEIRDIENILNSATSSFRCENKKILYVYGNRCSRKQIELLCKKLENEDKKPKQFHHFRMSGTKLEWICSTAPINHLKEFGIEGHFMNEEEFYNIENNDDESEDSENNDNNMIIFCGDAGLGKTTLMQTFTRRLFPLLWTVLLYPKNHSTHLKEINGDISKFKTYLLNKAKKRYKNFEMKVFECMLKSDRVNYIWDGLDEVAEEGLIAVLDMIETLSREQFKQYLTSRNNLRGDLECRFSVLTRTVKQFSDEDQKYYIKRRLTCEDGELKEMFKKIQKQINSFKYNEILSIPLQIYMFTELLIRDPNKYKSLLKDIFSPTDLFEHFIDVKFDIYFKEKENDKYYNPNDFKKQRDNKYKQDRIFQYQLLALKLHFPDQRFQADKDCKEILKEVKIKDVIGIITSVSSDGVVNFLHNSYGEYFAASYFSKNYETISNIKFLLKETNRNIRLLFDLILAKGRPLHIATLYQNSELLKSYYSDLLTELDQGGRTALQLACSWGKPYPTLQVVRFPIIRLFAMPKYKYCVYGMADRKFTRKETSDYRNVLRYLSTHCDYENTDLVYGFNALKYADETANLFAISELLKKTTKNTSSLKCFENVPSLLCYAAAFDFSNIFDQFKEIPEIRLDLKDGDSILSLAASHGSTLSCRKIMSKSTTALDLNVPLLRACENGHIDTVEMLIEAGADINMADKDGRTPLYEAYRNGHCDLVSLLIKGGAGVNAANKYGLTPLYEACWNGHLGIVNLLIKAGGDVNKTNEYGLTPLYAATRNGHSDVADALIAAGAKMADKDGGKSAKMADKDGGKKTKPKVKVQRSNKVQDMVALHEASEKGRLDEVRLLIEVGVDVDAQDPQLGLTALLLACWNGHLEVAELLIEAGADVNKAEKLGDTPLITASTKGKIDLVKLLIREGADVDKRSGDGQTALCRAAYFGFAEIVKLLIEARADVNIVDKKGETPMSLAKYKGQENVIKILRNA